MPLEAVDWALVRLQLQQRLLVRAHVEELHRAVFERGREARGRVWAELHIAHLAGGSKGELLRREVLANIPKAHSALVGCDEQLRRLRRAEAQPVDRAGVVATHRAKQRIAAAFAIPEEHVAGGRARRQLPIMHRSPLHIVAAQIHVLARLREQVVARLD